MGEDKGRYNNDKLEYIPFKNPGYFLSDITLYFGAKSHKIEFSYINKIDPIYKRIIFEKIAEAIKEKYEEVRKEYEAVQIIIPNHE